MSKSHVGMSLCHVCGEPKEILLDKRLKDSLPKEGVYSYEPCDKCKEYTEKGVILIEVQDGEAEKNPGNPHRTGRQAVVTLEAAERVFDEVPEKHIAYVEEQVWDRMGLNVTEEEDNDEQTED